ncbi:hypothetical protein MOQ_008756, partial [Trypanosoma cruzi marinkellei]
MSVPPSRSHSMSTVFTNTEENVMESLKLNRDACQEEHVDSPNDNRSSSSRSSSSGESTTGSRKGRNSHALDMTAMGPKGSPSPSTAVVVMYANPVRNDHKTEAVTSHVSEEDVENYSPQQRWRRDNNSSQVEKVLFSHGNSVNMYSPLNGPTAVSTTHRMMGNEEEKEEEKEMEGAATCQNP